MTPIHAGLMNNPGSYFRQLESALAAGSAHIPKEIKQRALQFVLQKQHRDGGFCGRSDVPDLYYTAFALHALKIVGVPDKDFLGPTIQWLVKMAPPVHTLVDLYSYAQALIILARYGNPELSASWQNLQRSLPVFLNNFCTHTGGYVARPTERRGSIYQTFLALLCYDLAELAPPKKAKTIQWLAKQQRSDGGFADLDLVPLSATNPTAAGLAAKYILGALTLGNKDAALNFLRSMYVPHLGFRANQRIVVPDLLSTFTALWTIYLCKSVDYIDSRALCEAIARLQQANGGFCASVMDLATILDDRSQEDCADVEYTFYGLASLALLAPCNYDLR